MFHIKCEEKILTYILSSIIFVLKLCHLRDNVENYGRAGLVTEEDTTLPMRCACWLNRATDSHSEFVIMLFHSNEGYANKPHYYFMPILLVLFKSCTVLHIANTAF